MEWMPNSSLQPASPLTIFIAQPDFQLLWFQPWGTWWTTELMLLYILKQPWEQVVTLADRWDGETKTRVKNLFLSSFLTAGTLSKQKSSWQPGVPLGLGHCLFVFCLPWSTFSHVSVIFYLRLILLFWCFWSCASIISWSALSVLSNGIILKCRKCFGHFLQKQLNV